MADATPGAGSKLAIDTSAIGTGSTVLEFESCSVGKQSQHIDTAGLRGTVERVAERTREGINNVGGQLVLYPTFAEMQLLMPLILGGNASGNNYPVAETLQEFNLQILKSNNSTKVFTYAGLVIASASFESSEGGPLRLTLGMVGKTETVGTSFTPTGAAGLGRKYMHHDLVLTLQSSARKARSLQVAVNNVLGVNFYNSVNATDIIFQDRNVSVAGEFPYCSANYDLYDQALTGAGGTAVYTDGTNVMTLTFGRLQVPSNSPGVDGRRDVPLNLQMVSRRYSTTPSIAATLAT